MTTGSPHPAGDHLHSVWVEVALETLAHNFRQVVATLAGDTGVMAVVKADGYGHGAVEAARTFVSAGAKYLGVSTVDQALDLRGGGIAVPILCFVPPLPDQVESAVVHGVTVTLHQTGQLLPLRLAARRVGRRVRCHLKVDTGMGRLGATPAEAMALAREVSRLEELELEGVYTHFATAQERESAPLWEQWLRLKALLRELEGAGIRPPLRHCANSAALLRLPECHLDMVRPGTLLYGDWPAPFLRDPRLRLVTGFRLCARLAAVRELPPGAGVGYGLEWRAKRPSRLGVLPVGYADGLSLLPNARTPSAGAALARAARELIRAGSGRCVLIGDQPAAIVGRIGMQLTSIDLTDLPAVRPGDVATVPCRKTAVPSRIPRVYLNSGR